MINNKTVDSPIEMSVMDMIPRLIAIEGHLSGQTFYLDEPVASVGRLVSNDICLEDPFVSRHHCVIRAEAEHYMIEDLNSANGTYVNGERVKASSLKEGSIIQIGTSRFLFRLQNLGGSIALSQKLVEAEDGRPPLHEIRSG